jgi:hypothetical protein
MRTSCADVFCAGDAADCQWGHLDSDGGASHWFQKRLWTQARTLGAFAGRCMSLGLYDSDPSLSLQGFNLDLFAHCTTFFNKKVVLLGRYNGQGLERDSVSDMTSYQRVDSNNTFIRVLLRQGMMVGAIIIGDTDLEETFENLIMNGTDLSMFGPHVLDPDFDIEEYFD